MSHSSEVVHGSDGHVCLRNGHVLQLVNYAAFPQTVSLNVFNATAGIGKRADVTVLTGSGPYATNSFDSPFEVGSCSDFILCI